MTNLDEQSEEIRGARGKRQSGGAEISHTRSSLAPFVMNVLQGLVVIALAFVSNNLYQINLTLAADAVSKQEMSTKIANAVARIEKNEDRDDKQEDHINYVDRRLYQLEGKNSRGAQESSRGR